MQIIIGIIDGRHSKNPVAFKILSKSSTSSGILGKVIFLFTQIINAVHTLCYYHL